MRRFWPLLVLALGGLFWWGLQRPDPNALPSVLVGKPAPTFERPLLQPYRAEWGDRLELGEQVGSRPILINFWASWCLPCRDEAPLLEAYWRRYRDRLLILGVNVQDTEAKALEFIREYGLSFPSVFDPKGTLGVDYGTYGVPETFVIDAEGKVLQRHAGPVNEAVLRDMLRKAGLEGL
ncbi:TlpA family protein disulfide reductase [Calidithermus chliarophilus]|uniref:TlpA family protein disulfide reductase n=1 Tax=Calidithermus chliarophilus TaxID=52023 RepID=UPI0004239B65|nr:redoxin domain-containing protein [Calidithermus chliarophilus]